MIARKRGRFRFRDIVGRLTADGFEVYPPDYRLSRNGTLPLSTADAMPTSLESQPSHFERLREINRRNAEFWAARKEQP